MNRASLPLPTIGRWLCLAAAGVGALGLLGALIGSALLLEVVPARRR